MKRPPVEMLPPVSTTQAPPMSASQSEVRQTDDARQWIPSIDDASMEMIGRRLKAFFSETRGSAEMSASVN